MVRSSRAGPGADQRSDTLTFHAPIENILSIMETARSTFSPASRRIVDFILSHRDDVVRMSITELADSADVSESAVTKLCKQIGAQGFQQVKISLARDIVQPVQFIQEDLSVGDDVQTVNEKIFHANIQALRDTLQVVKAIEMTRARDLILAADRVEIYGIGSAAPIAEDVQYRMKRIGLNAIVEVDSHKQAISAALSGPRAAVLTVSHSGATHETVTATRLAKESGASTICITNFGKSPIHRYADVVLQTMARETQFRTEAMTSRIAQLSIVDALIANLALASYDRSVATIKQTFEVLSSKRF
jgi:RpiR family carbohydrate utilization transcriptional regulator